MSRLISIFIAVSFASFLHPLVCWSATVQLKNGQKVEGDYQGGTSTEVQIKVGSQILKFKTEEIASIIFGESAVSQSSSDSYDVFAKAAKDALRQLKGIDSITTAGVTTMNIGRAFRMPQSR